MGGAHGGWPVLWVDCVMLQCAVVGGGVPCGGCVWWAPKASCGVVEVQLALSMAATWHVNVVWTVGACWHVELKSVP